MITARSKNMVVDKKSSRIFKKQIPGYPDPSLNPVQPQQTTPGIPGLPAGANPNSLPFVIAAIAAGVVTIGKWWYGE